MYMWRSRSSFPYSIRCRLPRNSLAPMCTLVMVLQNIFIERLLDEVFGLQDLVALHARVRHARVGLDDLKECRMFVAYLRLNRVMECRGDIRFDGRQCFFALYKELFHSRLRQGRSTVRI